MIGKETRRRQTYIEFTLKKQEGSVYCTIPDAKVDRRDDRRGVYRAARLHPQSIRVFVKIRLIAFALNYPFSRSENEPFHVAFGLW